MLRFLGRVWLPGLLVAAALFSSVGAASAAGGVRRAPAPAWVIDTPIPAARPERARQVADGLYFLLLDGQDRPGRPEIRYSRTAYKVTDRKGLEEGARIDVSFDPSSETLILHHVTVWRSGVAQDRLASAGLTVMRREKEAEDGVYTGNRTAHLELKDVRVGDIVDYAYSWESDDPLLAGAYSTHITTGWPMPLGLTRYRILWPHGAPMTLKRFDGAPAPRITPGPDRDEYLWDIVDPAPTAKEDSVPDWIDQWGRVSVSSMTSWAQVAAWALPLYSRPAPLPPEWAVRVDEIARRFPGAPDRITEALRLVQDDVRYVSLSIGAGSFTPRSPAEVIRSGYGDCKDKALLLVTVLRRLGITAFPALTDMDRGPGLASEPPGAGAFDHVIVRVDTGGKSYWLDPTGSQEGGRFPQIAGLSYGWALPIRAGQTHLEAIPEPQAPQPTMDVLERYERPRGASPDLTLTVTSTYRGADADAMRSDLASASPSEMEKKYLDFYVEMYLGAQSRRPLEISDDRDRNVLVVREAYVVPAAALSRDGLINHFPLKLSALTQHRTPPVGERRMPLWLPYPLNKHHRIVLSTPGRRPPAPADAKVEGKAFTFELKSKRDGDDMILDASMVGHTGMLMATDVEDFRADLSKVDDAAYAEIDLTSNWGEWLGSSGVGVIMTLLGIALATAVALTVRSAFRADAVQAGWGAFHPVSLTKFIVLSLLSSGLYPALWFWRCWRWAKFQDGQAIEPFWRATFGVFWLHPLFEQANGRLGARALPAWLGIAAAAGYFGWAVGNGVVNQWKAAPLWLHVLAQTDFIFVLPALIAVNRLNGAGVAMRANSRFTWRTAVGVAFGLIYSVLVIAGSMK